MNYASWLTSISTLTAIPETDTNLLAVIPDASTYANNRICRELDLFAANVRDGSGSTVAASRNFNIPTVIGTFLVVDGVNIITPAATVPDSGTRNLLTPVSRDVLDFMWPSVSGSTVPQMFAYLTQDTQTAPAQTQIIFGPWPDAAYRVEVIGKVQPLPLSVTNTTSWIGDNLADMYLMASMTWITGTFLKNFGSQADDPKSAQSYEAQYQTLKASAIEWEARKRFGGASWTSKPLEPTAQPQRG